MKARQPSHWFMVVGWTAVAVILLLAADWLTRETSIPTPALRGLWTIIGAGLLLALIVARRWRSAAALAVSGAVLAFLP